MRRILLKLPVIVLAIALLCLIATYRPGCSASPDPQLLGSNNVSHDRMGYMGMVTIQGILVGIGLCAIFAVWCSWSEHNSDKKHLARARTGAFMQLKQLSMYYSRLSSIDAHDSTLLLYVDTLSRNIVVTLMDHETMEGYDDIMRVIYSEEYTSAQDRLDAMVRILAVLDEEIKDNQAIKAIRDANKKLRENRKSNVTTAPIAAMDETFLFSVDTSKGE